MEVQLMKRQMIIQTPKNIHKPNCLAYLRKEGGAEINLKQIHDHPQTTDRLIQILTLQNVQTPATMPKEQSKEMIERNI
jgi:hypothetical protein